ncbi:MAG: prepilin-type N-terminal cleavage/methylation domain-containing protein [Planctomycetales bacterium]|nr:prepilin-type N-terminal cleavage/methylation domain-containing protein [Planctomycetales bacterium]
MAIAVQFHRAPRALVRQRGVTLIELMISVALTLLIVLAIVRVFDLLGTNVTDSRAILELSAQLRSATQQLQQDVDRITVRPRPPIDEMTSPGYLEIIEGLRSDRDNDGDFVIDTDVVNDPVPDVFVLQPLSDYDLTGGVPDPADVIDAQFLNLVRGVLGDTDDVLMMTVRSTGEPFRGRFQGAPGGVLESPLAEIVWWVDRVPRPTGITELTLIRRVLLISPEAEVWLRNNPIAVNPASPYNFFADNDISGRPEWHEATGRYLIQGNRLEDLSDRKNRFAHWANPLTHRPPGGQFEPNFPHRLNRLYLTRASDLTDVIATDVMGFDLRVYDPLAPTVRATPNTQVMLTPIDPGYVALASTVLTANPDPQLFSLGAYVDLGYGINVPVTFNSHFATGAHPRSGLSVVSGSFNPLAPRVYDTWTRLYERNGLDDNRNGVIDEGRDGLDQNAPLNFTTDDQLESETMPPYLAPLRGFEAVIRLRDAGSNQVRQASTVADFAAP